MPTDPAERVWREACALADFPPPPKEAIRMTRFFRRGPWEPLLPISARIVVVALLPIEAISRGLDYVTGDRADTTSSLTFVEQAMPIQAWGICCLLAGTLALAGLLLRRRAVCILGLHIAGATYAALAVGLVAKTVERGGDGFRTPVMFAVFALAFWGIALGYWRQGGSR